MPGIKTNSDQTSPVKLGADMGSAIWRNWQVAKVDKLEILPSPFKDFLYEKLGELGQDLWANKGLKNTWMFYPKLVLLSP